MKDSRLGGDPLERTLFKDTRGDKPAAKAPKPARPKAPRAADPAKAEAEAKLRADYAAGAASNYYIAKDGGIKQKILIYLPFDFVRQLKKEAVDARMNFSAYIEAKLRE
jgi:hypothetical protein